ncbi:unnamed protein product, partial [Medioppia subpectinata]
DIYNDVRALCIDHGPAFQRLSCIGTDDFILSYGRCEWTGNPVTYLDGLLLATMIQKPFRKTSVPVMIRRLCVDPRLLFDSIKTNFCLAHNNTAFYITLEKDVDLEKQLNDRYAVYSAEMPFRYNSLTRQLVSPGIEIDDLVVHPIARRPDTNLTLESYEFCPNNDMEAIDDNMRAELLQYIKKQLNDRYAVYSAEMPFRYNSLTRQLVSPGIEIDDLVVHPIARRPDTNLTLESYEFCPNNDMEAIDDSGEYAGCRADTGQRVMGIEFGRCIATHVNACVLNMAPIPDHWSMAEAVTVLNSYSTVYYALIKKANIRKGESVLIHSEAGSVSQAAINVCEHYGCDIYVTVGTEEEKQFLIKEYNIPENRIFRSRDMRFKSE